MFMKKMNLHLTDERATALKNARRAVRIGGFCRGHN